MPDPQHYSTAVSRDLYDKQCNWIKNNTASRNIKFTVWLGDLSAMNETDQWPVASSAMAILDNANCPYSVLPGNHDYFVGSWKSIHDRNLTKFNSTFPPSRYSGKSWYGGSMASGHNENNVCYFTAGSLNFMVISMEFAPRKEVLTWANNLITSHPNHRVIIATHAYMGGGGSYLSTMGTDYGCVGSRATDLFDECVSRHSNVFLVACGHVNESAHQSKTGVSGNTVYEMVVDYQQESPLNNGASLGNGWLRLLEFDPDNNKINASTVSVVSGNSSYFTNGVDRFYESNYNSSPTHSDHKWTWNYNMGALGSYTYLNDDTDFHDCYVNHAVGGQQLDPDIGQASNGDWAAVFESDTDSNGIYNLTVRGFDSDGNERFADTTVNTSGVNTVSATNPAMAMCPDGRFVIAFQSGTNAIKMRAYNANGTPVGTAEQTVVSAATGAVHDPDVAIDDNGNFIVVWEDDADGNGFYQIKARGFAFDYTERFPAKDVNSISAGQQYNPAIAMAPNGDYVVAWDDDQESDGVYDVAVRGFLANETQRFPQMFANATTAGQQMACDVAMDDTGRFVVVWQDDADLNGSYQLRARGFSATGAQIIPEMTVNQTATGDQVNPAISMDPSGNWVVVWEDSSFGEGYQIMSQEFTISGARVFTDDVQVNTVSAVDSDSGSPRRKDPVVSIHKSGRYVCAWADNMDGDESFDVLAKGVSGTARSLVVKAINGSVGRSPSDPFYKKNTSVVLTATPNTNYAFSKWQGDVPTGLEYTNPLTISMDANKNLTAVFQANTAPAAPTGLSATAVGQSQINLAWSDVSGNETNFVVARALEFAGPYTDIATLAANATAYSDTGLTSGTTYHYVVRATSSGGSSADSNEASATTGAPGSYIIDGAAATVTGTWSTGTSSSDKYGPDYRFKSQGTGGSYVTFTPNLSTAGSYEVYEWHPQGGNRTQEAPYLINYDGAMDAVLLNQETGGGDWNLIGTFNFAAGTSGNVMITDQIPEVSPEVVLADAIRFVYVGPAAPSSDPEGLGATAVSSSQIDLLWENAQNETGYVVARGAVSGGPYTDIASLGANVTTYSDAGLADGTTYYYVVRGTNAAGASGNSNEAHATTLLNSPAAPSGLSAAAASQTQINLTWTDNSTKETTYVVARATVAGGPYADIAALAADTTSYSDAGLTANTAYYYVVRAANDAGSSANSNEANATTLSDVPTAPAGLSATVVGQTQINLTWTDTSSNETNFVVARAAVAGGPYTDIATLAANTTSYSNTGLTANTAYYYVVRATNTGGASANSNEANAITLPNAPTAPTGLTAIVVSQTQINLTWTDTSSNETNFVVARSAVAGGPYTDIVTLAANTTSYSNTGLTANTAYYYVVRATNTGGASASSNEANATTLPNAPTAPTGLTATVVSQTQINLVWTDSSSNETNFVVARAAVAGGPYTDIATLAANTTTYSNTGLTANTRYYYVVRAINTGGASANSNEANATTLPNAPTAPTGLTATAVSQTQINLAWTDTSSNETNFIVARAAVAGGPYTDIATLAANTTTYSNTGLTANTRYYYVVRATNTGGASANSNEANATTLPNAPTAPTGLTATVVSQTQINLAWTDTSSNETNFVVARAAVTGGPYTDIATLAANTTSYSNTGLTANTRYYYVVRATNTGGASANSNEANATTLPNAPTAPTGLTATAVSQTQINLAWTDTSSNETNFVVGRSTVSGGPYTDIVTLAANTTSYSNTSLTANTRYYYVVRATNTGGASANSSAANALTWPSDIIVDNTSASFTASTNWSTGTSATDKYGTNYRFHDAAAVSDMAQWAVTIPQTRNYDIYAWWSQGANRSTLAPYILPDGTTVKVNQQANGGTWNLLGTKNLTAGSQPIKLSCWTTTGFVVIADAVKLVAK